MGNGESKQGKIASTSYEKYFASGIIPCCIGEEDGVGYILLALQPQYPLSRASVGGWNPLWGMCDEPDVDLQHSAAREAFEEAAGAVGSIEFLREALHDSTAYDWIFPNCFLLGFGSLSKDEREWVEQKHYRETLTHPFNKFSWEVKRLKWFPIREVRDETLNAEKKRQNMSFDGYRVRPFMETEFLGMDWTKRALRQLIEGVDPFPDAPPRWAQWRRGEWVSTNPDIWENKEKENSKRETKEK